MAQTQIVRCIKCNKILGTVDALNGDYKGITFNQKLDKLEKEIAKLEGKTDKIIKKTQTKAGYRVQKESKVNIEERKTVTCSCGQVNGIY